jgi:hypothetical protein
MAIFHMSVKNVGRSNGRSAVASAAYRAGEKLNCRLYGKEQDYTRKSGVEFKRIYAPAHAKEELLDREYLWNAVEKTELKKNGDIKESARLAKEFEVAFPSEVSRDQRELMLDDLCKTLVDRHGVIVDAVIHAPHVRNGSDARNYHAHIMFTTRSIDDRGELGKKAREFNDDGPNLVNQYRELWANLQNRELERAGSNERVSHLSNKERRLDTMPTIHEGVAVTALRRGGKDTKISLYNDTIKELNEIIVSERLTGRIDQELAELANLKIEIEYKRTEQRNNDPIARMFDTIKQNLDRADQSLDQAPKIDVNFRKQAPVNLENIKLHEITQQQQRQKEQVQIKPKATPEQKKRAAYSAVQKFNAAIHEKAEQMRGEHIGKRQTTARETPSLTQYRELAGENVRREQPELARRAEKAQQYLQREANAHEQPTDKQTEREARLAEARAVGERESAKTQPERNKEREQAVERQQNYGRPR